VKTQKFRSIVLSVISLGIILAFIYYLYLNADQYVQVLNISIPMVITLLALSLIQAFLNGLINVYMFRILDANLSQREGFLLAATSTLANQLPISGGILTKGFYLKYKYNLSYTKYFSATLALFVCSIAVYGLLGLAILLYWLLFDKIHVSPLLFIGFGAMSASLFIFLLPLNSIKIPNSILKWVQQALEGWMLIVKNPALVFKLLGIQTATMLLVAIRYWLAFHMVSQNVTISQVILFASASVLTQLVSFAPGGLGLREAIVSGIASLLGFKVGISVLAIGLDRLVSTVLIVILGWVSTILLGKTISNIPAKAEEQNI